MLPWHAKARPGAPVRLGAPRQGRHMAPPSDHLERSSRPQASISTCRRPTCTLRYFALRPPSRRSVQSVKRVGVQPSLHLDKFAAVEIQRRLHAPEQRAYSSARSAPFPHWRPPQRARPDGPRSTTTSSNAAPIRSADEIEAVTLRRHAHQEAPDPNVGKGVHRSPGRRMVTVEPVTSNTSANPTTSSTPPRATTPDRSGMPSTGRP